MSIGDICRRDIVTAPPDMNVLEVAKLMRQHHVGTVLIVDNNVDRKSPLGILTDRDIAIEIVAEEVNPTEVTVGDMMNRDLLIANNDDDILTTIRVMYQEGVRRLPVVNGHGKLIGIISMDDLLEFLATELNSLVSLISQERRHEEKTRLTG